MLQPPAEHKKRFIFPLYSCTIKSVQNLFYITENQRKKNNSGRKAASA